MSGDDKVKILLVDDQPAKLLSYEAILGELGETLVAANSAREALEHLLKSNFAVILVDVCMPEQDGFELVETIRTHHRFRETAIIFVSAVQMTDLDRIRGYASGAVDYVGVPIVPEILRAKVAVFVDLFRKTRQLEKLNLELEARVLERTAQLSETRDALRETDRRKDVFLATLAHELRNPLAPMMSALEILRRNGQAGEASNYSIEVLDRQLTQMARLIDDLLDLGRITRNVLELRLEQVELSSVLIGAIETVQPGIDAAEQTLEVDMPQSGAMVIADSARLSQLISNLLNNASKFTPPGGTIQFKIEDENGDYVFRIRDSGFGIDPDQLPRLFEPFYQVQRTPKRPNSGLGVGLTLVQKLAEMHGGSVSAFSEGLGKGSEFVVRIPARVEENLEASKKTSPSRKSHNDVPSRRILVVDDNRDAAESLRMLLCQLGHKVESAHDGFQAISLVEAYCPEVIIMDIGMPGMDGYEAVRIIRERKANCRPVLIAMTGWGQDSDKKKSKAAGFHHHLVKPVRLTTLQDLLANI